MSDSSDIQCALQTMDALNGDAATVHPNAISTHPQTPHMECGKYRIVPTLNEGYIIREQGQWEPISCSVATPMASGPVLFVLCIAIAYQLTIKQKR